MRVLSSPLLSAAMAVVTSGGQESLEPVSDQGDAIVKILAEVKAGTLGPVAGADRIDEIAMASGLCKEMKIDPRSVGVDITNRGGRGYPCWKWPCLPVTSWRMVGVGKWCPMLHALRKGLEPV